VYHSGQEGGVLAFRGVVRVEQFLYSLLGYEIKNSRLQLRQTYTSVIQYDMFRSRVSAWISEWLRAWATVWMGECVDKWVIACLSECVGGW